MIRIVEPPFFNSACRCFLHSNTTPVPSCVVDMMNVLLLIVVEKTGVPAEDIVVSLKGKTPVNRSRTLLYLLFQYYIISTGKASKSNVGSTIGRNHVVFCHANNKYKNNKNFLARDFMELVDIVRVRHPKWKEGYIWFNKETQQKSSRLEDCFVFNREQLEKLLRFNGVEKEVEFPGWSWNTYYAEVVVSQ